MINVQQLRELIIKPALNDLQLYSEDAEELLVFTCAVESMGGTFLKQINGPALGIYQMEPSTYYDIWDNYIYHQASLQLRLTTNFNIGRLPSDFRMVYDLHFATAMARIHYARIPEPLPSSKDILAIWEYYKAYYNTNLGASSPALSLGKYHTYINS